MFYWLLSKQQKICFEKNACPDSRRKILVLILLVIESILFVPGKNINVFTVLQDPLSVRIPLLL